MKYLHLVLFAAILSGCHKKFTDITGTVNGFTSGTVIIKDGSGNTKFTENIDFGKFHFHKIIDSAGYYKVRIMQDSPHDTRLPGYDIYLEPGDYILTALPESAHQYPIIQSSSSIQNELSAYYAIANQKSLASAQIIEKSVLKLNSGQLSHDELLEATENLNEALAARDTAMAEALKVFVNQNLQNHVAAHIMYQLDYDASPGIYYPIYQKFSDEEKKTPEGIEEGDKFATLNKLVPGATAPPLVGNTLDGKPFDPKSIHTKVILLEFWRSDYKDCRSSHKYLNMMLHAGLENKAMGIISCSLDTDAAVWKNAVKEDGLSWTQVSDLKGDASSNMKNWQIHRVPCYFLLDGVTWKLIKPNEFTGEVNEDVTKYLQTH